MNDEDLPQFGTAMPGMVYGRRPSAYGIAMNAAGRVLVCRRSRGRILLPGGGIDPGETPEEALRREVAEETAHRVVELDLLARAQQYHSHRVRKPPVNKLCHFFAIDVAHDPTLMPEPDHEAVWLSAHELVTRFTFDSHRWALERYVRARR